MFGKLAPNYSLTITEGIGNFTWYEFIDIGVNSTPIELEGISNENFEAEFNQTMWNSLSNGTATIRFYVNNSSGELGYLDAIVRIDILDPVINIVSPTGGFFNSTPPDYTIEISDPNLNKTWYTLNTNQTKHFFTSNGTIDGWSYLNDGLVTITFYANDSVSNENSDPVQVTKDIIDPEAPSLLASDPLSWTNTDNFNLSWSNPVDTSGITGAYYKLDSAPNTDTDGAYVAGADIESIIGISVTTDGTHTVYVWLVDNAGNLDHTNYATTQLYLDATDPSSPSGLTANPTSWINVDSFNLSWSNPGDTSGIIGAYYNLDSIPTSDTDGIYVAGVDIESITEISVTTDGVHNVYVWLNDSAGNIDYTSYATTQLYLDTTDPSSPSDLVVTPVSWTNIDSFNLFWSNPLDDSGIVGAYYKFDSAPTSNSDGVYVAGTDLESLIDISIGSDGTHTIYIWLNDSAGNVDHTNYATTQLNLDTTDPSSPIGLVASPVLWTNIDSFNLSWSNPLDDSGIVGAYYKLDAAPSTNTDGVYIVGANIESILGISVTSDGVHTVYVWLNDSVGNIDHTNYATTQLNLDTTDPSSPTGLTSSPDSWTNIDSFDLSWSNPLDDSGIVGAYYKLDSAPTTNTDGTYISGTDIESILGISVSSDGVHTVYVWLNDSAGNIDYTNYATTQLNLDTTDPSTPIGLVASPDSWTNIDSFNLSWSNPLDDSGIVGAYYKLDAAPSTNTDGSYIVGTDIESIMGVSVTSDGVHTVYVWLNDSAGNIDHTNYATAQLSLDTTDPSSPNGLVAIPDSWTNTDSFNLSWTNPLDDSGIVGAYYKLDVAPTTEIDGTYVTGADIESILGISVTSDGVHTVYVWLNDSAGNIDHTNYATTQLNLDTTDPSSPIGLVASPDSWTNIDSFNLYWSNPLDDSGIAGAYYKLNVAPSTNTDGIYVAGADIESILGISVSSDGVHTVYVWLNDSIGNIDHNNYATTQLNLDTTSPSSPTSLTAIPASWTNIDSFNLYWTNPLDDSGIVGAYYKLDAAPSTNTDGTYVVGTDIESIMGVSVTSDGVHTVYVWLNDSVGNIDHTHYATTQLNLDTTDPSSPIGLVASPVLWTNIDNFNLYWTNPLDDSGIVGAYYKLDAAPSTNTDGTYVVGTDIESIFGISVTLDGVHTVYVWLNDSAGNIDHTNYATTQLNLDTTDPSSPIGLVASPVLWTNIDSFNFSWANPSDTSGISGVFYKFNSVPTSNSDGIYVAGIDIESLTDISIGSDGTHTIYVWLNDTAGNIDHTNYATAQINLDTTSPSIDDDQDGDDTWRNTAGTTYDVDFSDPLPSSNLDYAQYIITSELGQGGIVSKDWTNIFANLGLTSYTNDWTIDFAACKEGINYISVRVYDEVGNFQVFDDVFHVKKDTLYPILTLNSPFNNTYCDSTPPINITVYEPNVDVFIYTVIGYSADVLVNNTDVFFSPVTWEDLSQGEFLIVITCIDILSHKSELTITLYKDTIAPSITINSPVNDTFWNSRPYLNITAIDPNLDTIWYSVDNVNITLQNNTLQQLDNSIWGNLEDEGQFEVKIYANDSFGHLNDIYSRFLYKDVVIPILTINSPLNYTYHKLSPILNALVVDSYFDSLWYRVESQEVALTNNTNQQLATSIWDGLDDEVDFVVYFYANDSAGNLNEFILNLNKDIRNPVITIINPNPNDLFGDISPDFEISISELNLNQMWYTLIGDSLNHSFSGFSGKIAQTAWDEFGNGTVTIRFYANDTLNNLGFSEVTVRKNIFAPILTIVSPEENDLFGIEAPNITIYKAGHELNTTWYSLDGGLTNFTFSGLNIVVNQAAWEIYGFEDVTITFYINDSLGEIGFDVITLRKDPYPPEVTITFINPISNNSYCAAEPTFIITAYDPNLVTIWYRVGSTNITIFNDPFIDLNNTVIDLNSTIWNSLSQDIFTIEVFAVDVLGYLNDSMTLTFYKDTLAPILVINQPYDGNYYNSPPPINITVYDPNFVPLSLTYTFVGIPLAPITLYNNTEDFLNQTVWNSLPQGEFFVSITAKDTFDRNAYIVLTLYKDTIAPAITINSPVSNTYWNLAPYLNVTAIDPNLDTIWYIANGTKVILSGVEAFDLSIWNGLNEGLFTIEFYANDTFGYNSTSVILNLIKDTTLPTITVSSPENNTYYSDSDPPTMDITMSDSNPGTIWYIAMGTTVILSGVELFDLSIWNSLGQGEFQISIFANDTAGNLNSSLSLTLYKDTLAPFVIVNSPINNTYWNSYPIFNVAAYDPNLFSISYKVLTYAPIALVNATDVEFNNFIWNIDVPEGLLNIQIIARDTLGNVNDSIILTIYKDTILPNIDIISPQPNDLFGENTPFVSLNVTDINLEDVWYRLSNGTVVTNNYPWTGSIEQFVWDQVGNGTVTIRFYANDTATNIHYEDVIVRKNLYVPIININSPYDNGLFGINSPNFEINTSGTDSGTYTWYMLIGVSVNYTFLGNTGEIDQDAWSNFGYELVTIRFYINNSLGKIGTDEVVVRKDPDMPIILVNSPINQTACASTPFINLIITDPNLHKVWYCCNNIAIDITNNLSQYLDFLIWNNLSQGQFRIEFFANDTLGNLNNICQLNLSKDTFGPIIIIEQPTENQKVDRNAPYFEVDISDENGIDSCWYTVNGNITLTKFTGPIDRINQTLWENLWDGLPQGTIVIIKFYANDTLGNVNYEEVHLTINKPGVLPKLVLYPLGFLIPTLGLIAILPLSVKLTKTRYYKSLNNKSKKKLRNVLITTGFVLSLLTLYFIF